MTLSPRTGSMSQAETWDKRAKYIRVINNSKNSIRAECIWYGIVMGPEQVITRDWAWALFNGNPGVGVWFGEKDETTKLVHQGQTIEWDGHKAKVYE